MALGDRGIVGNRWWVGSKCNMRNVTAECKAGNLLEGKKQGSIQVRVYMLQVMSQVQPVMKCHQTIDGTF